MKKVIIGLLFAVSCSTFASDCLTEVANLKSEIKRAETHSKKMLQQMRKTANYFYTISAAVGGSCSSPGLRDALSGSGEALNNYITTAGEQREENSSRVDAAFDNLYTCLARN